MVDHFRKVCLFMGFFLAKWGWEKYKIIGIKMPISWIVTH